LSRIGGLLWAQAWKNEMVMFSDDKVFMIEEGCPRFDEVRRLFIFEGRVKKL
jgi:hypothetical protein